MGNNEIKLEKETKFITKYGSTTDELKPSVVYLRSKARITPTEDKLSFEEDIDNIKKIFNEYVNKQLMKSKLFDSNYIFNIDISSKSVKYGKSSFLRYDIFLKPKLKKKLIDNKKTLQSFSIKLDNKLTKLLNRYNILCI